MSFFRGRHRRRHSVKRLASYAVLLGAAAAAIGMTPASADSAESLPSPTVRQVISMVNQARSRAGCGPVAYNSRLGSAARQHSADMAGRRYFSHYTPGGAGPGNRMLNAGYRWNAYGENIAWGQRSPGQVMNAWLNSPDHRHNILNCRYRSIGVGVAYNRNGTPYWTQDFGA
jgi:uncharacterized protein YkwD